MLTEVLAAVGDATSTSTAFDFIGPIAGTGLVGLFLLMIIFRIKIMPTWVHDEAKADWLKRETQLLADLTELKTALTEANTVYTGQVIPTLTRVLDAERELVDLRREEQTERRARRNAGT